MKELLRCLDLHTHSLAASLSSFGHPLAAWESSPPQEWMCGLFTPLSVSLAACLGRGSSLLPYYLRWPLLLSPELFKNSCPFSVFRSWLAEGVRRNKQVTPGGGCHGFLRLLVVISFQTSCLCLWSRTIGQEAGHLFSASPTIRPSVGQGVKGHLLTKGLGVQAVAVADCRAGPLLVQCTGSVLSWSRTLSSPYFACLGHFP